MNIYDPYEYGITQWHNSLPGGMLALYWIILGISIAAMWILFTKAHEEGWASIVPFYNMYVLFKITWGSGWLFLLLLIPIADIVIWIITMVKLAQVFGKGGGFACGLIFLNTIFECIIAFDNSIQYVGINGEYADSNGGGYGPTGGFGGSSAQGTYQSQPGYQNPYGGSTQNTTRQSSANDQYYYQEPAQPAAPQEPTEQAKEADEAAPAKFCPSCGAKLDADIKFCPNCGAKQ